MEASIPISKPEIEHAKTGPNGDGDGVAVWVGGDERAAHLGLFDRCVLHCSGSSSGSRKIGSSDSNRARDGGGGEGFRD
jgi:hypothetical protein